MSDNAIPKNDSFKFWTFLTIMLLAVAVTVTLIDLTIKASILAESNSLKLRMEEWEVRNGPKQEGRIDEGNHRDPRNNGNNSGDVLAPRDAGMEAGSLAAIAQEQARTRPRRKPVTRPSDGD